MTSPVKFQSILFLCGMNAIRSPMAEVIAKSILPQGKFIKSAGVHKGVPDLFVSATLAEGGHGLQNFEPHALEDLNDIYFDLIVALSQEAYDYAQELARTQAIDVEYWPIPDPSLTTGTRDQVLEQYRAVANMLETHIRKRFLVESDA